MTDYLCIFLGCGLGGICRYGISTTLSKNFDTHFPWATFAANILGCLLIGMLLGYLNRKPTAHLQLLAVTGFCGGFTTFSTFANETLQLLRHQSYGTAAAYASLSVVAGLAFTACGWLLTKN